MLSFRLVILSLLCLYGSLSSADTVRIAVASNFSSTLKKLSTAFETRSGHKLLISSASTGKLFAQIVRGAPYDVFLSADARRADLLVEKLYASRSEVYAQGRLVYIARAVKQGQCYKSLAAKKNKKIAIANPKIAPYGHAAKEVLEKLGLWEGYQGKLLMGENILQTYQYIATGNVDAGFVARSVVQASDELHDFCRWNVPLDLYQPISQKMAILARAENKASVKEFKLFMKSDQARKIIMKSGYGIE